MPQYKNRCTPCSRYPGCGSEHGAAQGARSGRAGAGEDSVQHPDSRRHTPLSLQVRLTPLK